MAPIIPPPLSLGDLVSVIAPAGAVEACKLEAGLSRIATHFQPVWHQDLLAIQGYLAGGDDLRAQAFQEALNNPQTRAIWAARGGFGTTRILDRLGFDALVHAPKWVVGSSDLTACLIGLWARQGLATIHGPMVAGLAHTDKGDFEATVRLLQGQSWTSPAPLKGLSSGIAKGPLIGGNLTVLAHLMGALPARVSDGAILFLEDVNERPYRLDRSLTQLKRAGFLEGVQGIVLGEFTECGPGPDGTTAMEVVESHVAPLAIPIASGYPAAHGQRSFPFIHGAEVCLAVEGARADLKDGSPSDKVGAMGRSPKD